MKLFRRRADTTQPANQPVVAAITIPETIPAESACAAIKQSFDTIALSAEQKDMLEKPLDPRVDRILQDLHADKAAAEEALKARRIIQFPQSDWAGARVEQDENGFWRIVPGTALDTDKQLFDCL